MGSIAKDFRTRERHCDFGKVHGTVGAPANRRGIDFIHSLGDQFMLDVLFIAVTVAFFAISLAYTAGCERL